ncbi:hypothetical protein ACH5RR_036466 [Cinchona calisaya]|uniref:Uncharacterized protein n=1 Tax=Cinchona calisaya TaxID=153742 RepID=A0ABD2Y3A0_9GENT
MATVALHVLLKYDKVKLFLTMYKQVVRTYWPQVSDKEVEENFVKFFHQYYVSSYEVVTYICAFYYVAPYKPLHFTMPLSTDQPPIYGHSTMPVTSQQPIAGPSTMPPPMRQPPTYVPFSMPIPVS